MLATKPCVTVGAYQRESRLEFFFPLLHTRMSSDPSQRNARRKVCCGLKSLIAFFVQFILTNPNPDPNFGIIHD